MKSKLETVNRSQYLTFFIAGEEYAVGILRVREIIEYGVLTRMPGTPAAVRGVLNLRGSGVPVVDLGLRLKLGETSPTKWTCVVIVDVVSDGVERTIGIMADSVSQVVDLGADDIEAPPAFGTRVDTPYLIGMARSGKKFIMLLDVDKVLADLAVIGERIAAEADLQAEAAAAADETAQPGAQP